MRASLFALCLVACTEDPALTPAAEPSSAPTAPATEAPPTPSAPTAEAPPEPANAPPTAADDDAAGDDDVYYEIVSDLDADEGVLNPDPRVARVLEGILTTLSRQSNDAALRRVGADFDPDEADEYDTTAQGDCGLPLLHEHLVTISCSDQTTARMDVSENTTAHHFTILGGEVRPFDPWDAFAPRAEAQARLRAACLTAVEEAEDGQRLPFRASCDQVSLRLDEDGLQGFFPVADYTTDENLLFTIELPYADVSELIPEDGLLMALFSNRAPPAVAEPDADATAVSHADLDHRLIAQWQTLDDDVRRQVGLRRWDAGLAQLVYLGDDAAVANALATRFGATSTRVHLESPLRPLAPTWVRTSDDLNLRTREDGPVLMVLPSGAIVSRADAGDRARFVEVLTPFEHGAVARTLLRPHTGCVPRAPAGFEAGVQPLTAIVTLRRAGRRSDGVLFAQSDEGHTRVAVHDLTSSSCAVGEQRFLVEADGPLRDARLTATTANGGQSLLVVGTYGEEAAVTYVAQVLGNPEPVWRATFDLRDEARTGVRLGESVEGAYFPVTFEERGEPTRLAWTGSELAPPATE